MTESTNSRLRTMTLTDQKKNTEEMPPPAPPSPPLKGILKILPKAWVPYGELMRLHRPAGFPCITFPYLFGSLFAACYVKPSPDVSPTLFRSCMCMLTIGPLLRSLSCTFNDIMDADLDRQVARCRSRPMARRAISEGAAYTLCLGQLSVLLALLWNLTSATTFIVFLPVLLLHAAYPITKRLTDFPQAFLGLTLAYGVFVGASSMDRGTKDWTNDPDKATAAGLLFLSEFIWSILDDTIYAFQDILDDKRFGIYSMAVRYEDKAQVLLSGLCFLQVATNAALGIYMTAGLSYYVATCGGVGVLLLTCLRDLDINDPASCAFWFEIGSLIYGSCMTLGLLLEYLR